MIFNWFRGIVKDEDLTPIKYNGDWSNLAKLWNDHNNGIDVWDNVSTRNINGTFIGLGRNRLINGDMAIDQRNEGGLVTVNASATNFYGADKWVGNGTSSAGIFKTQRITTTPPNGFVSYTHTTVTTADATPASGAIYFIAQGIEGYNIRDFMWGTSQAKTATLSFWVKSNLTGQFSGCLRNGSVARSYPFTYTINSASTWEQKVVVIAGDTTGTWATTNGLGLYIDWDFGSGSTFQSTGGTWQAGNLLAVTGSNKLITSTSNTFDITGVQMEIGSTASSFEFFPMPLLLQQCQRYYEKSFPLGTAIATTGVAQGTTYIATSTSESFNSQFFVVQKRTSPTVTTYSPSTGTSGKTRDTVTGADITSSIANNITAVSIPNLSSAGAAFTVGHGYSAQWTADCDF